MAHLKTETIYVDTKAGAKSLKVKISVNSIGEFYCYLPNEMITAAKGVFPFGMVVLKKEKLKVSSPKLSSLIGDLHQTLRVANEPEEIIEHVIRYNIQSDVSFAEDLDGNIQPNASFVGASWPDDSRSKYGDHHAGSPSAGGYGLKIGAIAFTKTSYIFGKTKKVEYKTYYKDGSHHGHDNPAELLNSWCSFSLNDKSKEIPYTDEAAMFFHNLMLGMANLSRLIQSHTFDEKKLLESISSSPLLLGQKTQGT